LTYVLCTTELRSTITSQKLIKLQLIE
jgi:hypothetical protein